MAQGRPMIPANGLHVAVVQLSTVSLHNAFRDFFGCGVRLGWRCAGSVAGRRG
jgi:hypothetical protein